MTQEPFGYFNNPHLEGWQSCAETDEGARPLYEHPPTTQINQQLVEALGKVLTWIENWSPEFTYDPDWPVDRDAAKAALQAARGEQ